MEATWTAPYNFAKSVTPSDTVDLPQAGSRKFPDALNIGTAGTVSVVLENDQAVTLTAVAGAIIPIKVKRVNALGTSAGSIVALYMV